MRKNCPVCDFGIKNGRAYPEYPPNKNALVLSFMVGIIAREVGIVNIRI